MNKRKKYLIRVDVWEDEKMKMKDPSFPIDIDVQIPKEVLNDKDQMEMLINVIKAMNAKNIVLEMIDYLKKNKS